MRLLKVVMMGMLAAMALAAGLFITAVVALGSIFVLSVRRLFGGRPGPRPAAQSIQSPKTRDDVIEVSATEVAAERDTR